MEFQEFWKEKERMCAYHIMNGEKNVCCLKTNDKCGIAKLADVLCPSCEEIIANNPQEAEQIVEQWAKEHPIVTNADKFKEVFGASIGCYGFSCPPTLEIYGIGTMSNDEWLKQEYQPPKGEEG